jgi:integrase
MISQIGWSTLAQIEPISFERWRNAALKTPWREKRGKRTPQTVNQWHDALNAFLNWCVIQNRIPSNPLALVQKLEAPTNDDYRRAATKEELELIAPHLSEEQFLFVRLLLYTGSRRASGETLKWGDVNLSAIPPYISLRAQNMKSRRQTKAYLRQDLADALQKFKPAEATPDDLVFPNKMHYLRQWKAALEAAGVKFDDGHNRNRLDIHAFKKTLNAWAGEAGIDIRIASKMLQHSNLSTTEKHYSDKRNTPAEAAAAEMLPKVVKPPQNPQPLQGDAEAVGG